jgi:hypothetical protein
MHSTYGTYIALATPFVMALIVLFVPYRAVPESKYRRARLTAFTLVGVSVVWLAIAVSDIFWGGPFVVDLVVAVSITFASVYILIRVLGQTGRFHREYL